MATKKLINLTIILLLFACAPQQRWAKKADWDDFSLKTIPGQSDYPEAGAVILLDSGDLEVSTFKETPFTTYDRHRVVKILNKSGYQFSTVTIPYDAGSEIESIEARTIAPDGRITVLMPDKIYDINLYPQYILYSDQRAKIFTFPAVEPGCIVEYRYRLSIRNHTLVHNWQFQDFAPCLISRFSMRVPAEWNIDYNTYNAVIEPKIEEAPRGFKNSYFWEARDLPAIESEFGMPPLKDMSIRLTLSPAAFEKWDDVAAWYHGLSDPMRKQNAGIAALADSLTGQVSDSAKKVKILFEWVRDNIRYIAVAIGIGGFQPHAAEEVLRNRYGDCKDMTTLLCAMADAAGIDMHPVIVCTKPNGALDTSLVSPYQFNHLIAYHPLTADSDLWLDATKKGCPFGQIPWYNQGTTALIVEDETSFSLRDMPSAPPLANLSINDYIIDLHADLSADISGHLEFYGAAASEIRQLFLFSNRQHRGAWLESFLNYRFRAVKLDSFTVSGLRPLSDPLKVDFRANTPQILKQNGDILFFDPAKITATELGQYFIKEVRENPIVLRFGFTNKTKIQLTFPNHLRLHCPLPRDSLETDFGKAHWQWSQEGQSISLSVFHLFNDHPISAGRYKDFRDFLSEMEARDARNIIFRRNQK